jgi:Ni/Co efflux regulator RcnB
MKTACFSAALAILLLSTTGASAQDRHDPQFNEHDRQVAQNWYTQHQHNAPKGMRSQDRLTPDQEQRLQPGKPLDRELQRRSYSVPRDLKRQLPPAPKQHQYVVVGHHVVLEDSRDHVVRDVVHLHDQHPH